jgi:hypothetical protein
MAAQHLWLVGRQVELAPSHIDPHVVVGRHQIGVAREPETHNVEQCRKALVWNGDVDVLEVNGIPEVFGGAIECLLHDQRVLKLLCPEGELELGHNSISGRGAPSELGAQVRCEERGGRLRCGPATRLRSGDRNSPARSSVGRSLNH